MKQGFSLMGLLVVIVIIGLLCAVFMPQFKREVKAQHTPQVRVLRQAQQLQQQLNAQTEAQQRMLDRLEGNGLRTKKR